MGMGNRIISKPEATALSSLQGSVSNNRSVYQEAVALLDAFIGEANLTGNSWESAKSMAEIFQTLVQSSSMICDQLSSANAKVISSSESLLTDYIDEKVIEEEIQSNQMLMRDLSQAMTVYNSSIPDNPSLRTQQRNRLTNLSNESYELQKFLDSMHNFDMATKFLYDDILSSMEMRDKLVSELSDMGKLYDESTGQFTTKNINIINIKALQDKIKSYLITSASRDEIINDYIENYGLDKETSIILYNLQQAILKKAKEENWSNAQIVYEYSRLVASCSSNFRGSRWYGVADTVDENKLTKLLREYGLSSQEIEYLKLNIQKQHESVTLEKDLAHEAVQMSNFAAKNLSVNRSTFPEISIKAQLARDMSLIGNMGREKEEISFKGDVDSGRYDYGDFNSNLDAINVFQRQTRKEVSREEVFTTQAQYNNEINNNQTNRVQEFYKNYGDGDLEKGKENVEDIMDQGTIGRWYIRRGMDDQTIEDHQTNFSNYLEEGKDQNIDHGGKIKSKKN